MYQGASLWVDAWQCARTYGVQRPGKTSGAHNRSLCGSAPVLSGYSASDCSPDWGMPRIPVGRFFAVPLAPGGGLALFVPAAGAGGLPDRPASSHRGSTEGMTGCASPPPGWKTSTAAVASGAVPGSGRRGEPRRHAERVPVSPVRGWIRRSRSCTCRGLVMDLSCTCRIPAPAPTPTCSLFAHLVQSAASASGSAIDSAEGLVRSSISTMMARPVSRIADRSAWSWAATVTMCRSPS